MKLLCLFLGLAVVGVPLSGLNAGTATFSFAPAGNSYLAFLPSDDPLVGLEVVSARIFLDVEAFSGSDAANFFTDITFPIEPFPGNENGLVLTGDDLGWSGSGVFHFFEETDRFNGRFIPVRYGAETPGENFDGVILAGSRIEFIYVPEPATWALLAVGLIGAVVLGRSRRSPDDRNVAL
jgi:hypothetical protein